MLLLHCSHCSSPSMEPCNHEQAGFSRWAASFKSMFNGCSRPFPQKWPEIWPILPCPGSINQSNLAENRSQEECQKLLALVKRFTFFWWSRSQLWMSGDFSMHYGWIWYHPTAKKHRLFCREKSLFQTQRGPESALSTLPCKGQTQFGRSKMYWAA